MLLGSYLSLFEVNNPEMLRKTNFSADCCR